MLLLLPFVLCLPQSPTTPVAVPRIDTSDSAPVIDGVLDEPFWAGATVIQDLAQVEPVAGAAPSERTEILLAYDANNLYVGLRCFDSSPDSIRATQMERDANLDPDDRVELLFDTFNDSRTAFWFQLGAAGSRGDSLISQNGTSFNKRWDTIWYAAAGITDEGWFGEIRIPFASINFNPENPVWGFNVRRFIRRHSEEARWSGIEPRLHFFGPVNAGKLSGFEGLEQGTGLDVVPFFVGTHLNPDDGPEEWLGDTGLDLFYRISPSTKLSLSFNTDFAETEVDSRRINLSRFPLFFPEKRKFFLEDSGVFNFGSAGRRGSDVVPFFSRRIGLDGDGGEVPLLFNAKLTSTNDSYSFGLLDSQTEETASTPARNLFVGRFSKNILEQSSVGVIYTSGDPSGAQDDFTAGVDLNLQTNEFLGDKSLRFRSYVVGTEDSATSGDNLAYSGVVEYPNDEWSGSLGYTVVEDNFAPALGFVRRAGIRRYEGNLSYSPRLHSNIRRLKFEIGPRLTTLTSGEKDTELVSVVPLGIEWESGEKFETRVSAESVNLLEDFVINDPVTIPAGTHDFMRFGASFETSQRRDVSAEVKVFGGGFYDGEREDYALELDWRLGSAAFLGMDYDHNDIRLPDGNFRVNVARVRANVHFSPRMSWKNFVQWDDLTEDFSLNSRLRWIFEPGRDLFLVLNQGWTSLDDNLAATSTDLRVKVSYTFRF
ncbi:MAG: hypothetical protein ACI9F9_000816 [Candidatus Paceibacteria bacterium]|jgi:hypothetical protein